MELSRVIGPPGCGKTTYLARQVRLAWESGKDVMLCSLTRAAAAEMAGRDLPIGRDAIGTLHAHAYRSLSGGFSGIADDPKHLAEWNKDAPEWPISAAERDLDEDNADPMPLGETKGDKLYGLHMLNRARMRPEASSQDHALKTELSGFAKKWDEWKRANDLLDFTDLLEIALADVAQAPGQPDVIFADERQDLSRLEASLLYKWGEEAGMVVECGDPWQCLYEWRGSDPDVFYQGDATTERILAQSYRVPHSVHQAAVNWMERMPGYSPIEYRPTDQKGLAVCCEGTYKSPESIIPIIEKALGQGQSVMYLASCSYMLDPVIKVLRQAGIPFHNQYRVKNGKWNPLSTKRNSVSTAQRLAAFLRMGEEGIWSKDDLREWLSIMRCSEVLPGKESYKKFEPVIDNMPQGEQGIDYGLLSTLVGETAIEASMTTDTDWVHEHAASARQKALEFPSAIAKRSGRDGLLKQPRVTIGTIHSVKGGESDVVILAPDVSQRGANTWHSGPAGRAAIFRLFYVGMTRAKSELYISEPASQNLAVRLMPNGQ